VSVIVSTVRVGECFNATCDACGLGGHARYVFVDLRGDKCASFTREFRLCYPCAAELQTSLAVTLAVVSSE
jgi:hypothetical protein